MPSPTAARPTTPQLSNDFIAGAWLAIFIAILPIGFWLTFIATGVMLFLAITFVMRLHTPITSGLRKTLETIFAIAFVLCIAYKPLVDRYKDENEIPFVPPYIRTWGTPVFNGVSGPPPAKLISGPGTLLLSVDGTRLHKFKDKYKLVGIVSHALPQFGDYMESSDICKSTPYTITDGVLVITIPLCQSYMDEITQGAQIDRYWLLAVPIESDQLSVISLSGAVKSGGQIIGVAEAKPASLIIPR
jgi:hypothetical protein